MDSRIAGIHRRCDHRAPDPKQHHSVPLLIRTRLLLFFCQLLQLREFLQPCSLPVDIPVFIGLKLFVRREKWRQLWLIPYTPGWWRHYGEVGVESTEVLL